MRSCIKQSSLLETFRSSYFSRPKQNNPNSRNLTNREKNLNYKSDLQIHRKAKQRTVRILILPFEFLKGGGENVIQVLSLKGYPSN